MLHLHHHRPPHGDLVKYSIFQEATGVLPDEAGLQALIEKLNISPNHHRPPHGDLVKYSIFQ